MGVLGRALALSSCVTLSKALGLSEPFFACLQNEAGGLYRFWEDAVQKAEVDKVPRLCTWELGAVLGGQLELASAGAGVERGKRDSSSKAFVAEVGSD